MFHFHISSFQSDEDEVESENVLSDLVNYIQPVHFKSFEHSESENINLYMRPTYVKISHYSKSVNKPSLSCVRTFEQVQGGTACEKLNGQYQTYYKSVPAILIQTRRNKIVTKQARLQVSSCIKFTRQKMISCKNQKLLKT